MSDLNQSFDLRTIRFYCLGTGEVGCVGCSKKKNWDLINELSDEERRVIQSEAKRVDDMDCILLRRPWYEENNE